MKYANSLLELIGNTPLVKLNRTVGDTSSLVLAKVEYLNPGGSVKDRIAVRMIDAAEASGELQPGGTIVEPTSGNTGVGLALVAQQRGYHCIFVCPDKVSEDKLNVLRSYGADVVVCPTAVAPDHPDSYYSISDRLVRETEGAWKPDQYSNANNPLSHYEQTGPEIWEQTDGKITHFVTGMGTGGTISGVGRYLKEQNPEVGASSAPTRPARLLRRHRPALPGRGCRRGLLARDLRPRHRRPDHRGLRRRLLRDDPAAGARGGAAGRWLVRHGGVRRDRSSPRSSTPTGDAVIVVLLPDSGRGYLTKVFNDDWLARYGFLRGSRTGPDDRGGAAREEGRHPRAGAHPPQRDDRRGGADPAGVRRLADARGPRGAADHGRRGGRARSPNVASSTPSTPATRDWPTTWSMHMDAPLPTVGAGADLEDAIAALRDADALLVQDDGDRSACSPDRTCWGTWGGSENARNIPFEICPDCSH